MESQTRNSNPFKRKQKTKEMEVKKDRINLQPGGSDQEIKRGEDKRWRKRRTR